MRGLRWLLGVVIVLALLGGGMAGAYVLVSSDGSAGASPQVLGTATPEPLWSLVDSSAQGYPRPDYISDYQWALIEDGRVSDEELLDARDATVRCIADAGLDVRPLDPPSQGDRPSFMVVSASPGPHPAVDVCKQEHMDVVDMLYAFQDDTRLWVTKEHFDGLFDACIRDRGFPAPATGESHDEFWTVERLEALVKDPAGDRAFRECGTDVSGQMRSVGHAGDAGAALSTLERCLQAHGYEVRDESRRPGEWWTPERMNAVPSVPGLQAIWDKCQVITAYEGWLKSRHR